MPRGAITSYIDVAQVVLYAFWAFFAALIFYLRREDRREGYPLESEVSGRSTGGHYLIPAPKTFLLHDGSTRTAPRHEPEVEIAARKTEVWPGAPLVPVGDPMKAGVGPGSWTARADVPDLTHHGDPVIVPMRVASTFSVAEEDPDPRGMAVVAADRAVVGTVKDIWIDRAEFLPRYYEVALAGGGRSVLLPVTFALVDKRGGNVHVSAILGEQFAGVPATKSGDQITKLEEEKITAYYGAGTLYATPARAEPLL